MKEETTREIHERIAQMSKEKVFELLNSIADRETVRTHIVSCPTCLEKMSVQKRAEPIAFSSS